MPTARIPVEAVAREVDIDLTGVCFDGSGRKHGQAEAPAALRAAGLGIGAGQAGPVLHDRVRDGLAAGRFPLV